ncbi:thiamine-monophosphate kinase [Nitrobacter sp. Nb-311A]|uniref:thiamine-phosphate kinase n=1 Tax=unclassified Nitrobacter TaxID=2620411 RepID=UPI000068739A|nr:MULTISPECIES: thiamine-phosphate kinase [unclassified Nitrobacter]EAQ35527.1 thiamine-monophosphate kinase [Nitrobacter sp. Nb-311A]MCB1392614.1 thiamine-phosphate kinase [Nitrobacter sp.]MCV0385946.1 thiamine-phosphate kinase [Nitrobacter sp.]
MSGEDDLIARYFKPIATDPGALGLADDAAVLRGGSNDLVVTTDAIVEGVHFLSGDPPETVARKALRVNLSDLAAKGATPAGFVLSLALREQDETWLSAFASGLAEDAITFDCPLLGGDTVATPGPLTMSITAFGRAPPDRMVLRSRAQPGDRIVVSGTIGDATLGLAILSGKATVNDAAMRESLIDRYRIPQPRVGLAEAVRNHARAAMDVSDGLAGDLVKLCKASGVSAIIDAAAVPLSEAAHGLMEQGQASFISVVSGGDDYEILCTIAKDSWDHFAREARNVGVAVTPIGEVIAGDAAPKWLDTKGEDVALSRLSYSHF